MVSPPSMLQRLRPALGHARLSNAWRFGSSSLLPRAAATAKPSETAFSRRLGSSCRLARLRTVSKAAAPATQASPAADTRQAAEAGAPGDAGTGGRSTAYPFTEIEAKWQRCAGTLMPCMHAGRWSIATAAAAGGVERDTRDAQQAARTSQCSWCMLQPAIASDASLPMYWAEDKTSHTPVNLQLNQDAGSDVWDAFCNRYWAENKTFRTPEFRDLDTSKPKFYALDMFPYPRHAAPLLVKHAHAAEALCGR